MLPIYNIKRLCLKPFSIILAAIFLAWLIIFVSFNQGYRMTAKYAILVDAAMEIKLEATMAHLWFEEVMSGDNKEDISTVIKHIQNSSWYAKAMLQGGENSEGNFQQIDEPKLREMLVAIVSELQKFESLTHQRYENFKIAKAGSDIDIQYDQIFRHFISLADQIETELQELVKQELHAFQQLHYMLALLVLLAGIVMLYIAWRYEKSRFQYLQTIEASQQQLEKLSNTDALTGLANRRLFDATLETELKRAIRDETSLTLLMIDVDFFKKYNDHYGHQQGDSCLKQVAHTLSNQCHRPTDLPARFGGEEFAVILPNTPKPDKMAQRICDAIYDLKIEHQQSDAAQYVTVSIGVATLVPSKNTTSEKIIKLADDALYLAKSNGRNQFMKA